MTLMQSTRAEAPRDNLLPRLNGVKSNGQGKWGALCPCHDDHEASLHIEEMPDGSIMAHCFACKANGGQVATKLVMPVSWLFPPRNPAYRVSPSGAKAKRSRPPSAKCVARYIYRYLDGSIAYRVSRWEWTEDGRKKKTFEQERPNGEGGWVYGTKNVNKVLYRLPELMASNGTNNTVFIAEGEKKVEALVEWGLVATCNAGGAEKWLASYSNSLRGRDVVILPDNDPADPQTGRSPGLDHAAKIVSSLKNIASRVRVLALPDLPPKGDIVDWIEAGHTKDEFLRLVGELKDDSAAKVDRAIVGENKTGQTVVYPPLDLRREDARTDIANGKRLIAANPNTLRFVAEWKAWLVWDGRRWSRDLTNELPRRAQAVCAALWTDAEKIGPDVSEMMISAMRGFARYSSNGQSIERMVKRASELPEIQVRAGDLDNRPLTLNCLNGTVNLETGEIHPHCQEDMLTQLCPVEFDPSATCPTWERFLLSIFGGQEEFVGYIRRLCGYWSTGIIREQLLPILHGVGANGKTTFINVVMNTLGNDYTMKSIPDLLMRKPITAHPTEKADLFRKRFVAVSETDEGGRLSESTVKELTGSEKIRARRMREDFWEFEPTHKLALVTNHKPGVTGNDHGMWRRLRLIPFAQIFWNPDTSESGPAELMQDKELPEKLDAERSGILTWIVRGAIEFLRDGEQATIKVAEHTREYRESLDTLGQFIEERCIIGAGRKIRAADLYRAYVDWCKDAGHYAVSMTRFGTSLSERDGIERVKNSAVYYVGIELFSFQ